MIKKDYNIINDNDYINVASGVVDKKITIPLVVTLEDKTYHGFVPGIVMNDIIENDIEKCLNALKEYVKKYVLQKIKNKQPFPFFPTNEEIKSDFKNVVHIKRLTAKVE